MSDQTTAIGAGAGTGATLGAAVGSIVPGVGNVVGGAVGAVVGGVAGWVVSITGGKRNIAYYNTLVADIHRTYPGRDIATCRAAIDFCQTELGKGKTGEWKNACTDCLKEYTAYLQNAQAAANQAAATGNMSGFALLTGNNVKTAVPSGVQSLLSVSAPSSSPTVKQLSLTSWLTIGVGVFVVFQLLKD